MSGARFGRGGRIVAALRGVRWGETLTKAVLIYTGIVSLWSVAEIAEGLRSRPVDAVFPDFSAFLIAGRAAADGRLADAYSRASMAALERADGLHVGSFMHFAYPPPFALAMAALAGLPSWLAYPAFDLAGLLAFLLVLRRFGGDDLRFVAAATAPALYVNLVAGQSGLLISALAGLSAALAFRGRSGAGGALAGLVGALKPQLAVALPVAFLLRRDARALAAAAAAAALLFGLARLSLGPTALPAFLDALSETGRALSEGRFPLHRMTSVYACLRDLGLPTAAALTLHFAVAACVLALVAVSGRGGAEPRGQLGLALMATAFVSPYFYDYDGPVVGLGLALALPALGRSGRGWRFYAPLVSLGLAGLLGSVQPDAMPHLSVGAPLLLFCFGSTLSSLVAGRGRAPAGLAAPA